MPVEKKIYQAQKNKLIAKGHGEKILQQATEQKVITDIELALIQEAEKARRLAITVDDFLYWVKYEYIHTNKNYANFKQSDEIKLPYVHLVY